MAARYRRFTKILFLVLNCITAVVYLLACLAPQLNPMQWWPISLLGLGFIFIFVTLIAFIFFWLVFKPVYVFISLVTIFIGYKSIALFFGFHKPEKFDYSKSNNVIRVAHWNVARFTEWKRNNNRGSQTRLKMMDLLKEQNADVLCLQEFFTSQDSTYYDNLNHVMKEMGYPYFYYSWDNDGYLQWVGQIIFSRLPFIDSGMIRFPRPTMPEALIHVDLLHNNDTIRIYTTHLQSVRFQKQDFDRIEKIKNTEDSLVENSRSIFGKLKRGIIFRARQAEVVREMISQSPYPFILTGDFNDVPNSYAYATVKDDDLQDIFLEKGFGIGRTYLHISPTLRIDYMFATKDFQVKQFNRVVKDLSDHYMMVADFQLRKDSTSQ